MAPLDEKGIISDCHYLVQPSTLTREETLLMTVLYISLIVTNQSVHVSLQL